MVQSGHILAGTTVLLAVAGIVVVSTLDLVQSSQRTIGASSNRSTEYFLNEKSLGLGVGFLRSNSTSLVQPFSRSSFYTLFDRTEPSIGSNDTSSSSVPTKIKLRGTQKSALFASSATLGDSEFPATLDAASGANVAPVQLFNAASLGQKKVRITLIDAVPVDPTKDFGDPDLGNPQPQTDFKPIYRIDSMDSPTQGGHIYGHTVSSLQYDYGVGFYGRDLLELRQSCDSYISNSGPYSSATRRANCSSGSNNTIAIHSQTILYGTARTNGSLSTQAPFGGTICADFASAHTACTPGTSCQGASCQVAGLPNFSDWSSYCPTNQGAVSPTSGSTLTVLGNSPSQRCWQRLTIGNNRVVTLTSTQYPYFIDTLDISNTGRLNFAPSTPTGTITLYVRKIINDRFNGNQIFNINNKPYQLRVNYLGNDPLLLNGTAAMNSFVVAPYAPITISGNFTFSGGIKATSLVGSGSGSLHYDESGDITTLKDVSYTLRSVTQHYR
jgi:hypothetical protein